MVTLQQALANQNLGSHYEKLGKGIYLSFDQKGWSVKKFDSCCFGFIQRILRYLGFYSSTHLKNIYPRILGEKGVPEELKTKIAKCCGWILAPRVQVRLPFVNEAVRRVEPDPNIEWRTGVYVGDTLISVELGDLAQVQRVKAIVNAANTDLALLGQAGPSVSDEFSAIPEIRPGVRCEIGRPVITRSGGLSARGIERIIHTDCPVFDPEDLEVSGNSLEQVYVTSLDLAYRNGIRTIAFPPISTGSHGFPKYGYPFEGATQRAVQTVETYAARYPGRFNEIKLIFDHRVYDDALNVFNALHPAREED